jgi:hypothetical protein
MQTLFLDVDSFAIPASKLPVTDERNTVPEDESSNSIPRPGPGVPVVGKSPVVGFRRKPVACTSLPVIATRALFRTSIP